MIMAIGAEEALDKNPTLFHDWKKNPQKTGNCVKKTSAS